MAIEFEARVEVAAAPEEIWAVLADFDRYGEWTAFQGSLKGQAAPGRRIRVTARPRPGKVQVSWFRITAAEAPHLLCWCFDYFWPRLIVGERYHIIKPRGHGADRRTTVRMGERFRGPLLWLLAGQLRRRGNTGFQQHLALLKARVEGLSGDGNPG